MVVSIVELMRLVLYQIISAAKVNISLLDMR